MKDEKRPRAVLRVTETDADGKVVYDHRAEHEIACDGYETVVEIRDE